MAKVKMKKIEIIALIPDSKKITERLQRRGVVEFCDIKDEQLVNLNTSSSISVFEKNLASVLSAKDILAKYSPVKKPLLSFLNGRVEIDKHDFGKIAEKADEYIRDCYEIISFDKKITSDKAAVAKLSASIDLMSQWETLDVNADFSGTEKTACFIGTVPTGDSQEFISSVFSGDFHVCAISGDSDKSNIAVICHRDDAEHMQDALKKNGFIPPYEVFNKKYTERIYEYKEKIKKLNENINSNAERIAAYSAKAELIDFAEDYLRLRIDKYKALACTAVSQKTFIIDGFVPEKAAYRLQNELERKYMTAVRVYEPDEDDDIPVLLQNNAFSAPVEGITEMYALPNKKDIDPSAVMAFFYYLFFGMMLSDAGYGLLMFLCTAIILRKTNVEGNLRRSLTMFRNCGISTLFWGILFGSWFGDAPQVIAREFFGREIGSTALWFEPIEDPIKLLLFSFLLGILHLFLGLATNFIVLWKQGKKKDALFDVIPIYLTVGGIAPAAAGILTEIPSQISKIGMFIAAVGAIMLILTSGRSSKNVFMKFFNGLYGVYNVATGYLSDILSYSRLLALGLATGSIASVINLICSMIDFLPIKIAMFVLVFPLGHIANFAINLLGAYVHTARLQFVELFSKFYEGGGRPFSPLAVKTKYIKFKEDITNE